MSDYIPTGTFLLADTTSEWNTIVRSGRPIVLTTTWWTIPIALLTLLYREAASRLFKPYSMVLFWFSHENFREWDVGQLRVAMANTENPLAALKCKPAYRVAFGQRSSWRTLQRTIAMLWILGGFFLAVFPLTVPLLKTKVVHLGNPWIPFTFAMSSGGCWFQGQRTAASEGSRIHFPLWNTASPGHATTCR